MAKLEGKTINELVQVEDIDGKEIIPLSVPQLDEDGAVVRYVTRGITLDNLFKLINQSIKSNAEAIEGNKSAISEVSGKLDDASASIDANSRVLVRVQSSLNTHVQQADDKFTYVGEQISGINSDIEALHEADAAVTAYAYASAAYIKGYVEESAAYLSDYVTDATSYLTSYVQADETQLRNDFDALAYSVAGSLRQVNDDQAAQNESIAANTSSIAYQAAAITALNKAVSYNAYVNAQQQSNIETIYYGQNEDAFDDWSNPNDDVVTPPAS